MTGSIQKMHYILRLILVISIAVLCNGHADRSYANGSVSSELRRIARDLDAGSLHRLQVFWLRDTVATIVGVTPEIFDEMVDDQVTAPMIMPHCDFALSDAVRVSLGHIFKAAAESAVKGQPREVHWRLRFYG